MLENLVRREYKVDVSYELVFDDGENNGFAFPCDKDGNVSADIPDAMLKNLYTCLKHPEAFERYKEVVTRRHRYAEPAHGTCVCGREVWLWDQYMGACECECGRWYNLFGQELLPPEYWEDDD